MSSPLGTQPTQPMQPNAAAAAQRQAKTNLSSMFRFRANTIRRAPDQGTVIGPGSPTFAEPTHRAKSPRKLLRHDEDTPAATVQQPADGGQSPPRTGQPAYRDTHAHAMAGTMGPFGQPPTRSPRQQAALLAGGTMTTPQHQSRWRGAALAAAPGAMHRVDAHQQLVQLQALAFPGAHTPLQLGGQSPPRGPGGSPPRMNRMGGGGTATGMSPAALQQQQELLNINMRLQQQQQQQQQQRSAPRDGSPSRVSPAAQMAGQQWLDVNRRRASPTRERSPLPTGATNPMHMGGMASYAHTGASPGASAQQQRLVKLQQRLAQAKGLPQPHSAWPGLVGAQQDRHYEDIVRQRTFQQQQGPPSGFRRPAMAPLPARRTAAVGAAPSARQARPAAAAGTSAARSGRSPSPAARQGSVASKAAAAANQAAQDQSSSSDDETQNPLAASAVSAAMSIQARRCPGSSNTPL